MTDSAVRILTMEELLSSSYLCQLSLTKGNTNTQYKLYLSADTPSLCDLSSTNLHPCLHTMTHNTVIYIVKCSGHTEPEQVRQALL